MFQRIPESLYHALLSFMRWLAIRHPAHHLKAITVSATTRARFGPNPTLMEVDAEATRLGARYRGISVAVALATVLILFLAVLPYSRHFKDAEQASAFDLKVGVYSVKVALMACVLLVILLARKLPRDKPLKVLWIEHRLLAEELRYESLRHAIDEAREGKEGALQALLDALHDLTHGGPNCQITYNQTKLLQYESLEALVVRLTWAGFAISFLAAGVALFAALWHQKWPWLLIFTLFVPAAVAVMHGLVALLKLPQLSAQHEAMLVRLRNVRQVLDQPLDDGKALQERALELAANLHQRLVRGDIAWTGLADRQEHGPI